MACKFAKGDRVFSHTQAHPIWLRKKKKCSFVLSATKATDFFPVLVAAMQRAQHQDKLSNNTPWFCNLHSSFEIYLCIFLINTPSTKIDWLTWPLNWHTGDIWDLTQSKPSNSLKPETFKEGQHILREQISYRNDKFIIPARLKVSNVQKAR